MNDQICENLKHPSVSSLCLKEHKKLLKVRFEIFPNESINSSFLKDKFKEKNDFINQL